MATAFLPSQLSADWETDEGLQDSELVPERGAYIVLRGRETRARFWAKPVADKPDKWEASLVPERLAAVHAQLRLRALPTSRSATG